MNVNATQSCDIYKRGTNFKSVSIYTCLTLVGN